MACIWKRETLDGVVEVPVFLRDCQKALRERCEAQSCEPANVMHKYRSMMGCVNGKSRVTIRQQNQISTFGMKKTLGDERLGFVER